MTVPTPRPSAPTLDPTVLRARLAPALALLAALAWSTSAHAGDVTVAGSSGKYFPEKEAACAAAQADASSIASATCTRDGGAPGTPAPTECTCEQGGFEGAEWLCNAKATVACAAGATAPAPRPASSGGARLSLDLPSSSSSLDLLSADFRRRGLTLPAGVLTERYKAACDTGWALACDAPNWHPKGPLVPSLAEMKLETACDGGDGAACIAHGWVLERKAKERSEPEHYRAAARRYKAQCDDQKVAYACYEYGAILFNNLGVTADPRLGAKRWEDACTSGEAAACTALARVYKVGAQNIKVDLAKAMEFAKKACTGGDPYGCLEQDVLSGADAGALMGRRAQVCRAGGVDACWELASELLGGAPEPSAGMTRGVLDLGCELGSGPACANAAGMALQENDDVRAAAQFRQACAADEVPGCVGIVDMLQAERAQGSIRQDRYAFEVACSKGGNANACSELGLALLDGESIPRDPTRARALLRQSCVDKSSPARPCFVLGDLFESGAGGDKDRTLAAQYYKWACAQGWGPACTRRGDLLHGGVGVRQDDAEAVASYQTGCDAGLAEACQKAAVILDEGSVIARDPARARDLYTLACDKSIGDACLRLGKLHVEGVVGGKDEAAARDAYDKGVALGNVEAHRHLARLLWNGLGGKKDKKRAKELCAAGCRADDPIACRGPAWQTE